jgi:large repetitive protein
MSRSSALLSRIAAACALLLVAALLAPAGSASAARPAPPAAGPTAGEMSYACALKSNGLLRAVTSLSECKSNETKVTLKPGPDIFCVQPSGSTRLATKPKDCNKPATALTLPPTSGTVYFCAAVPSGTLRYVPGPGQCLSGEVQVQVTPNDAAPRVTSTSPADGADHVATDVSPTVTFSEPVTGSVGSFDFLCGDAPVTFSVTGSPGSTLTLHPGGGSLPQGATCTITTHAAGISDVDTLDPPDNPTADSTFSFTTDAAPRLVSSQPVGGATGVPTSTNIVMTFSEPVVVPSDAFTLNCGGSDVPYTVAGSHSDTIGVDPAADLPQTATCTLSAPAASITDVDSGDPPDALSAPLSITFTTVDAAPSVTSTTPGDGAPNVATTADVSVTFSEPVTLADGAFTLTCGGSAVTTSPSTSDDTTFTFTPTADLRAGDTCTGRIDRTKVSDKDAVDPPDNPGSDYAFGFRVDSPPAVDSTDPADNAKDVPAGKVLTVTFTEPVTVTKASFVLTCNGNAVDFALGGTATAVTLTPSTDLPGTATCTLKVVAAQVHDVDSGDPPDTMTANTTITFTTVDTAPSVLSISPADGATDVSSSAKITVTFSEPVTAESNAFGLACPIGTAVSLAPTGSGTEVWTLTPSTKLPVAKRCTLTITATKIHDVDSIDPPDEMLADVTSQFTVAANSAPTGLSLSASTVAENQPSGTAVGTFSSTDPDPGDTFTYSLVSGLGDADNTSFTIVGNALRTAATFDFETKSTYSIQVRTTDSAGNFLEETFTITVTDANEAPTDISLSTSSVPENKPAGTVVGTLSSTDPDAGDTFAYSLVAGTGSTDNASFSISGSDLQTAGPFDFETKTSYSVRVRSTDSGGLTFEKAFTISVTNVNEAPLVVGDSYSGAIGNTLAVLGVTATGPSATLTGDLPLANDKDPEGAPISVVAATITTSRGGTATINADGTFSYLPAVGDANQTDTFTYTVTDGQLTSTGTISIGISADRVWWVNAAAAPGGDGRSTAPFTTLAPVNGAGDADSAGDYLFVYNAPGSYAGGLALEANERLYGERYGLTIGGTTLVPAGLTAPTITNASGNGITLASGVDVQGVAVASASTDGIHADNVNTATVGSTVSVSGSGQDGIELAGGNGAVTIAASVSTSTSRSVAVSGRTGGTAAFTGAVSGPGIALSSNSGATVAFSGPLAISAGTSTAFSATGGGTVTATDTTSSLTSTTGTTLVVDNTTIGAAGLKLRSVSANGAANGIRLNGTGSSGGLSVLGSGDTSVGGNSSGGTIQGTTGAGVSLTSTASVSLNNLMVTGTANAPGIDGTGVAGFSFTNGTVTGNGTTSRTALDSNIAFNDAGTAIANVTGALTVSGSTLTNAYGGGIHVVNKSGALSAVTITNDTIQSPAAAADSIGSGVQLEISGSTSTTASIGSGSISANRVTGYPNGAGIALLGGNASSSSAPSGNFGASGSHLAIATNLIAGASSANPMATQCILITLTGRGTSYVDVQSNGTTAAPLGLNKGNCISVNVDAAHVLSTSITDNVVKPQTQVGGAQGIAGGTDKRPLGDGVVLDAAVMNAIITGNTVSTTPSAGIDFFANSRGTLNARIQNNNVSAPTSTSTVSLPGIRVRSGTSTGTAIDTNVCLQISSNTSAGNTALGVITPGIGLRKQGSVASTNDFGVVGLSSNPSTIKETETLVSTANPASASGTFGTGGAAVLGGDNFIPCTLPFS